MSLREFKKKLMKSWKFGLLWYLSWPARMLENWKVKRLLSKVKDEKR